MTTAVQQYLRGHKSSSQIIIDKMEVFCFFPVETSVRER